MPAEIKTIRVKSNSGKWRIAAIVYHPLVRAIVDDLTRGIGQYDAWGDEIGVSRDDIRIAPYVMTDKIGE